METEAPLKIGRGLGVKLKDGSGSRLSPHWVDRGGGALAKQWVDRGLPSGATLSRARSTRWGALAAGLPSVLTSSRDGVWPLLSPCVNNRP